MIDNIGSKGLFSTTLQNMIVDAPLNLIMGTLKEYLDDSNNYTLMGTHNDFLQSALMNIDSIRMQYDLSSSQDVRDDLDNLVSHAYSLVKDTFCKEFEIEKTDFDETFRTLESNQYAMEIIYEILYNRRMELVGDFLEYQIFSNFDSIVKGYKTLIDVKDICYQGLKNSVSLPNKDYYVFILAIKEEMKSILTSADQYRPMDVFIACKDISEVQLESLVSLLDSNETFLPKLFNSVLSSNNYHNLEVYLKKNLLQLTVNKAEIHLQSRGNNEKG